MQQEPAPARSSGPQQDPALPHTSTMPTPEPLSAGQQRSSGHSPTEQATEEDFQFLRCQGCRAEAKCPKLLPCLHTLCSGCLEVPSMRCPICKVPQPAGAHGPALDNVFFESLQRRLSVYRQIATAQAVCTRCRESADFWCFECEQLLCAKCFEAHQWFLKHEARPLAELRSQSVCDFLDSTRKSNNIFCSNPTHRTPELTSIYCRGCSKPLCCTCALLDSAHSDLKCGIGVEIQQRQEELDSMTHALQEQDQAFGAMQAQMNSSIGRLARMRTDTEELIRARVRQIIEHARAQESLLLEAVNERYQRDYGEIAGQMGHMEAVLQRIHTGSALVQRMKRYASDQEVLEMHTFLRDALSRLQQEKPQDLQAAVRTDSFDEFRGCLQDLISCITQRTDAAPPRRANPEVASSPRDPSAVDLPERTQMAQAQPVGLAESQPVAVVQSVPGAHPMPVYAYSIKDPSRREEFSNTATSQKRKSCQTDSPRKVIKMESEAEKEARLAQSSPEQPRPSTSKAVSPPHLDEPTSPKTPTVGNEVLLLNSNHTTGDSEEAGHMSPTQSTGLQGVPQENREWGRQQASPAGPNAAPQPLSEERVVVISSDDSDAENQSFRELDDSSSESSDLQLEGSSSFRVLDDSLASPQAEDRPLVFFDLKIDNETQKISQLAAVNQESKFRVLIQPEAFNVYSKAVSLEVGLQHFLRFLTSMCRPILACYKLWGPSLPYFFRALEDMNRLWEFKEATSGFLATLPLIQERVPQASSFKLRSLAKTYLARNMSERSALAAVLAMRDLCRLLEVSPGPQLAQHVYFFSNLQCFASLQPLVLAAVLSRAEARLLALHNVSYTELLTAHRRDPQRGLKKYSRYLQDPESPPAQPALNLQALNIYFRDLLARTALARAEGPSAPLTGHSLASQQS
nr:PREDICTED: protein PML isoform X2 [Rhinolophus sinicus]